MSKLFFRPRTLFWLALMAVSSFAQTAPDAALPIAVQRQGTELWFVTQPSVTGLRAALYDLQGALLAESGSLTETPLRWVVPMGAGTKLQPGVYLGVFWLRGQGSAMKRFARLELRATTQNLQSAEEYLRAVEPPKGVYWGTPEYRAVAKRAYAHGQESLPFFRLATKVLPEETSVQLLLVRAIQAKYAQFSMVVLAPPPPPPPPGAVRKSTRQKAMPKPKAEPEPEPTPAEKQEMLAAGQKAVAAGKTCAEKNYALQWLAAIQSQLNQHDDQLATLEQLASASCATTEVRAQSWYQIGVQCWQCAYDLTLRYANRQRLASDPFHLRTFPNAADQRQFETCLQRALTAIDNAITLDPNFAEAWSYRSLLHREQQKTAATQAEQQKFANAAEEAAKRAMELTAKRRER